MKNTFMTNILILLLSLITTFFIINLNVMNVQVKIETLDWLKSIFLVNMFFLPTLIVMYFLHAGIKKMNLLH